jgi:23S rRNA pseudouridine1911/1915/1917 synthase
MLHHLIVEKPGVRLDKYLSQELAELSRTHVQKLIEQGQVTVNDNPAKASLKLNGGDRVTVTIPSPTPSGLILHPMPLSIVYEDSDILVIDKPPGLPVHPAAGHANDTLVNAVLAHCPYLPATGSDLRPGVVHRLDKDTSGLIVMAKNDAALSNLQKQIKQRTMTKRYLALVQGHLTHQEGTIEAPIGRHPQHRQRMAVLSGGREARTSYRVLQRLTDYDLLEVTLETGRTHQIRVHLSAIGYPVAGDSIYGVKVPFLKRQFLHACCLGLHLPSNGKYTEFRSELPPDLSQALNHLRADRRSI